MGKQTSQQKPVSTQKPPTDAYGGRKNPALPPHDHDGGNWPSTEEEQKSGCGRGNAVPKKNGK